MTDPTDQMTYELLDQILDFAISKHEALCEQAREGDRKFGRSAYRAPSLEEFLVTADPSRTLLRRWRARREAEPEETVH